MRVELKDAEEYVRTSIDTDHEMIIRDARKVKFLNKDRGNGTIEVTLTEHGFEVVYQFSDASQGFPRKVSQVFEFRDGEVLRVDRV